MAAVSRPRPLTELDDRNIFDCGRDSLNAWFKRHALANHFADISRINVVCDIASGRIIAYVALSACQVERAFLPKPQQRNRPDPIPVTLLGQLAVDMAYQGQGHAASLLDFALRASLRAADVVGSVGVLTHPLDDGVRAFYERWGFRDLPFDPRRAMFVRMIDLRQNFAAGD